MKNKKIVVFWGLWFGITVVLLYHFRGSSLYLLWLDMKNGFRYAPEKAFRIGEVLVMLLIVMRICKIMSKNGFLALFWKIDVGGWKTEINTHKLSYGHIVILVSISFFILLASMFFRDISARREGKQLENISVAHAFGGIDDNSYTNSKDALLYNYDLGHRTFEVDFSITSDNKLVCVHDWAYASIIQGRDEEKVLSKEEFENGMIHEKYKPISLEELLVFMSEHEDVWIVTDSKEIEPDLISMEFNYIVDTARSLGIEKVLERIAVQIYNPEMYQIVCEIYEFPSIVFTLYKYWDGNAETFPDICRFCVYNDIPIITTWYFFATPEVMKIAKEYGIEVYVHTVNDMETVAELKRIGVKGFYTDFLTPEMLENE